MKIRSKTGTCFAVCVGCEDATRAFEGMTYDEALSLEWTCPSCAVLKVRGEQSLRERQLSTFGLTPAPSLFPVYTRLGNEFKLSRATKVDAIQFEDGILSQEPVEV